MKRKEILPNSNTGDNNINTRIHLDNDSMLHDNMKERDKRRKRKHNTKQMKIMDTMMYIQEIIKNANNEKVDIASIINTSLRRGIINRDLYSNYLDFVRMISTDISLDACVKNIKMILTLICRLQDIEEIANEKISNTTGISHGSDVMCNLDTKSIRDNIYIFNNSVIKTIQNDLRDIKLIAHKLKHNNNIISREISHEISKNIQQVRGDINTHINYLYEHNTKCKYCIHVIRWARENNFPRVSVPEYHDFKECPSYCRMCRGICRHPAMHLSKTCGYCHSTMTNHRSHKHNVYFEFHRK